MVAVDALTRMSEHYPMKGCCSSEIIVQPERWVGERGAVRYILLDNASYFTTHEMSRRAAGWSTQLWLCHVGTLHWDWQREPLALYLEESVG